MDSARRVDSQPRSEAAASLGGDVTRSLELRVVTLSLPLHPLARRWLV
jgi:hypothetical protein